VDLRCRDCRPQAFVLLDVHAHILTRHYTQHYKMQDVVRWMSSHLRACVFHLRFVCLAANDGCLPTFTSLLGPIHRCKQRKVYGLLVDVDHHRYLQRNPRSGNLAPTDSKGVVATNVLDEEARGDGYPSFRHAVSTYHPLGL
jgi:hypothetical protein